MTYQEAQAWIRRHAEIQKSSNGNAMFLAYIDYRAKTPNMEPGATWIACALQRTQGPEGRWNHSRSKEPMWKPESPAST